MSREHKYELYDLLIELPEPLVRRSLRLEVHERIERRRHGRDAARRRRRCSRARGELDRGRGESVAISFLHAYANPAHERRARDAIARAFPKLFVSLSSEVAPQIREYERTSTTVANAYIKPLADSYLERLAGEIAALGITAPLFMMLSNGGLTHVEEAKRVPIQLLESGPAAGALAGELFGTRSGVAGRARVRHGRHHRQARDGRRRRAADRLQLRGEPREALRRGQRAAGQDFDDRADRDRRGRRQDRGDRYAGAAQGRAAQRGRRAGSGVLRPRRQACRR